MIVRGIELGFEKQAISLGGAAAAFERVIPGIRTALGRGATTASRLRGIQPDQSASNILKWFMSKGPVGGAGSNPYARAAFTALMAPQIMSDIGEGDYLSALGHGLAAASTSRNWMRGGILGSSFDAMRNLSKGDLMGAGLSGAAALTTMPGTGFSSMIRATPGLGNAATRAMAHPIGQKVIAAAKSPWSIPIMMGAGMLYTGRQAEANKPQVVPGIQMAHSGGAGPYVIPGAPISSQVAPNLIGVKRPEETYFAKEFVPHEPLQGEPKDYAIPSIHGTV